MVVVGEDGRVGIRSSEFGQSDPNIWHRPSASETAHSMTDSLMDCISNGSL